jgi:DeoR family transcriptional regulator, aga operon transcriptional repressor
MVDVGPAVAPETPPDVRRERMLAYVGDHEYVPVAELSREFAVSDVTVRSDLAVLARRGLVTRIRGGAMPSRRLVSERSFEETAARNPREKAAIGRAAAAVVQDGESIAIDVGTTTAALAQALVQRSELQQVTVFTNGLRIAAELEPAVPRLTVVVTGGTLRPMQHSLVDPLASDIFDRIRPHIAFIGASGFDPEHGVTNVNLPEAELKTRMVRSARRVVLLVDGSKIGQVDVARVCATEDIGLVVTGRTAASEHLQALDERGVDVIVAPEDNPD